jgi:hypothetical protein
MRLPAGRANAKPLFFKTHVGLNESRGSVFADGAPSQRAIAGNASQAPSTLIRRIRRLYLFMRCLPSTRGARAPQAWGPRVASGPALMVHWSIALTFLIFVVAHPVAHRMTL